MSGSVLEVLRSNVLDEGTSVSFSWLCLNQRIHPSLAKRSLAEFLSRHADDVEATVLINGITDADEHMCVKVVPFSSFEAERAKFSKVIGAHIYSVSRKSLKNDSEEASLLLDRDTLIASARMKEALDEAKSREGPASSLVQIAYDGIKQSAEEVFEAPAPIPAPAPVRSAKRSEPAVNSVKPKPSSKKIPTKPFKERSNSARSSTSSKTQKASIKKSKKALAKSSGRMSSFFSQKPSASAAESTTKSSEMSIIEDPIEEENVEKEEAEEEESKMEEVPPPSKRSRPVKGRATYTKKKRRIEPESEEEEEEEEEEEMEDSDPEDPMECDVEEEKLPKAAEVMFKKKKDSVLRNAAGKRIRIVKKKVAKTTKDKGGYLITEYVEVEEEEEIDEEAEAAEEAENHSGSSNKDSKLVSNPKLASTSSSSSQKKKKQANLMSFFAKK